MARIKIRDLPKDRKISRKEMRKFIGGASYSNSLTQFDAGGVKFNPGVKQSAPVWPVGCASTLFVDYDS